MYINFNLCTSKGLSPADIIFLAAAKQNRTEDNSQYIERHYTEEQISRFKKASLIEEVKPSKKNDTVYKRLRLTKTGAELLRDIQTYQVLDEDIIVFNWLKELYISLGKEVGSEKKCKELIAWFRCESGISKNSLIKLIKTFTEDEERMEYSKVLQYVFWVQAHRYQKDPTLEDSKLWLYYEKYQEKFDNMFKDL